MMTKRVVHLMEVRDGFAHDKRIEDHVLDALDFRRKRNDAGSADTGYKALRCQTGTYATLRLPTVLALRMKLRRRSLTSVRAECLRMAEGDQLPCPSSGH